MDESPSVSRMREIKEENLKEYMKKNADYGDSFHQSVQKYGMIAALTRMSDKFARLESLILSKNGPKVNDESIIDTLNDMANYANMTRMEIEYGVNIS